MWELAAHVQIAVSIVFYFFGMTGVLIAYISLRSNRQNQREANARRAYLDYARLGIDHPEFAFPRNSTIDLEAQTMNGKKMVCLDSTWHSAVLSGVGGSQRHVAEYDDPATCLSLGIS